MKSKLHRYILAGCAAVMAALTGCQDDTDIFDVPNYTLSGEPVTVEVQVRLPEMEVKSRADLSSTAMYTVNSLWIRTYSASTGKFTSDWKICTKENGLLPANTTSSPQGSITVPINSLSGSSYIVAVANVETNRGVKKSVPAMLALADADKPLLSTLLNDADTWTDFLDIAAVMPNSFDDVYAPTAYGVTGMPMSGCYVDEVPLDHGTLAPAYNNWGNENFQPYFIPAQKSIVILENGAIHLRRPISHIFFEITHGADIANIKVNSYTVFNVPRYAWLYEREAEDERKANFGDDLTDESEISTYWASSRQYPNQYISTKTVSGNEVHTFDFWQTENKYTGNVSAINYSGYKGETDADKQKTALYFAREKTKVIGGSETDADTEATSTTVFASLVDGNVWTPSNMASYVRINCTVEYGDKQFHVDDEGNVIDTNQDGDDVYRVGEVQYLVHLGYVDGDANDFNCYRNVNYHYTVTVNGVDDVRVDAYTESMPYPGEQGIVSDMTDQKIDLDCHYHTFNIELSEDELNDPKGFGYLIVAYRNGVQYLFDETTNLTDYDAELYQWIELRAVNSSTTSSGATMATYTPATPTNSTYLTDKNATFFLADMNKKLAANGLDAGTYTVFVNEYVYEKRYGETGYGNESGTTTITNTDGIKFTVPKWATYVNQDPRRFYIKTTQQKSVAGDQIYARSKYGMSQQSIQTYFSTEIENTYFAESIIGVERENENLGLTLNSSFSNTNTDGQNGRYNTALWIRGGNDGPDLVTFTNKSWYSYIQNEPLNIPDVSKAGNRNQGGPTIDAHEAPLNAIVTISGTHYFNDPSSSGPIIEAMNSCMNRNRDNNGNGVIDSEELRWYVPTLGQYLRMVLGAISLEEPIIDYLNISKVPFLLTTSRYGTTTYSLVDAGTSNASYANDPLTRYMFAASNVTSHDNTGDITVLWALEGLSSSTWGAVATWGHGGYPWDVRCVRNLGTNLTTITKEVKTTQAYEFDSGTKTVKMTYYDTRSIRPKLLEGNGTGQDQMPVHLVSNDNFNAVFGKFQYSETDYSVTLTGNSYSARAESFQDIVNDRPDDLTNSKNPCTSHLGGNWRFPNQTELGIMRNLGIITSNDRYYLCSSVNVINSDDGVVNSSTFDTATNRPFVFNADHGFMLTDKNIGDYGSNLYVRCVQDVY